MPKDGRTSKGKRPRDDRGKQKGGTTYVSSGTQSEPHSTYTLQRWYDTSRENDSTTYGRVAEAGQGSRIEQSQYRTAQKLDNFTDWFVADSYDPYQGQYQASNGYGHDGMGRSG